MRQKEQLRRRDPKAHTAMILGQREKDLRQLQELVASRSLPPAPIIHPLLSTQPVRWDGPMIATGDMLRPPSTAPAAANTAVGNGNMMSPPSVTSPCVAVSQNPDQAEFGPSSSTSETGDDTFAPSPKQIQASLVAPQRHCGTPEFTTHDLQNHVDNSITYQSNNKARQLDGSLREAIGNLFGDGSLISKGLVPKALQKATRGEFQAIISRKCLENKYDFMAGSHPSSYARDLNEFIVMKAKTEKEYSDLTLGLTRLLDEKSVSPEILLEIFGDMLRQATLDAPIDGVETRSIDLDRSIRGQPDQLDEQTQNAPLTGKQKSGHHKTGSGHINGVDGDKTEMNGMMNVSKGNTTGRKRDLSAEEEHTRKKVKRTPAPTPNFSFPGEMEKTFEDLLSRESARSSRARH